MCCCLLVIVAYLFVFSQLYAISLISLYVRCFSYRPSGCPAARLRSLAAWKLAHLATSPAAWRATLPLLPACLPAGLS